MVKTSIVIWLIIILIKIYDFFYITDTKEEERVKTEQVYDTTIDNKPNINFNPDWEGYSIKKNHDKLQLNKNK